MSMRFTQTLYKTLLASVLLGSQDSAEASSGQTAYSAETRTVAVQSVPANVVKQDTLPIALQGHPATWSQSDRQQIDADFPEIFGISTDSAFGGYHLGNQPVVVQSQSHPDVKAHFAFWQTMAFGHAIQTEHEVNRYAVGDTLSLGFRSIGYHPDDLNLDSDSPDIAQQQFVIDGIVSLAEQEKDENEKPLEFKDQYYQVDTEKLRAFMNEHMGFLKSDPNYLLATTFSMGEERGPVETEMSQYRPTSIVQTFLNNLSEAVWVSPSSGEEYKGHKHPVGLVLRSVKPEQN